MDGTKKIAIAILMTNPIILGVAVAYGHNAGNRVPSNHGQYNNYGTYTNSGPFDSYGGRRKS